MNRKKLLNNTKKYTCEFCEKSFARENTVNSHVCVMRDRYNQRNESYVKTAHNLWKEINNLPSQYKEIQYFEKDKTYKSITEFTKYAEENNYTFIYEYGVWLLKNKIIERNWYKNEIYQQFLKQHLLTEHPREAVVRSIEYIANIDEMGKFFKTCQVGKILTYIETGRVSPWLVLLADNTNDFLDRLENEKLTYFKKLINFDVWQSRMKRYEKSTMSIKKDLKGVII
jgi:hypothetical protein